MLRLFLIVFFAGLVLLMLIKWLGSRRRPRITPRRTPQLKPVCTVLKSVVIRAEDQPAEEAAANKESSTNTLAGEVAEVVDPTWQNDAAFTEKPVPSLHERRALPREIITLYIMAPEDNPYRGYELLQALLACGLRYGHMNIFHRYEDNRSNEDVAFSLASAEKPGHFDLPNMGSCVCKGLVLFMPLAEHKDNVHALSVLLKTAGILTEELTGELRGSDHLPLDQSGTEQLLKTVQRYEALKQQFKPSSIEMDNQPS